MTTTLLKEKLNAVLDEIIQEGVADKLNEMLSSLHVPGTPKRQVAFKATPKGKKSMPKKAAVKTVAVSPNVPSTKQCVADIFNQNTHTWLTKDIIKSRCLDYGVKLKDGYLWNLASEWDAAGYIKREDGRYKSVKSIPNFPGK